MKVFVTVGTTEFDGLITAVCSVPIQTALKELGYSEIIIQAGKSKPDVSNNLLSSTVYDYKPSLQQDMEAADLVISHAGAGTCLEVLDLKKDLIVVVNDSLMGNHQIELAEKLAEEGYLEFATLSTLESVLRNFNSQERKRFPKPDPQLFSNFLLRQLNIK